MRNTIFYLLLFFVTGSFAQTAGPVPIPGTKCSMVPPAGFVAGTNFTGFQHVESGSSIMVNELPAPYQTMTDGFTAEALKSRGMTLLNKEPIDFNGGKATWIQVSQPANGTTYLKQILLFGDEKQTVIVNGIYPETEKSMAPQLKAALLSTVYISSQPDNAEESANFSIQVAGTGFSYVQAISGTLLYSLDGKIPTERPTFLVGGSLAKVAVADQENYSIARLKKLPRGESMTIRISRPVKIDQLNGYEIEAEGKTKDNTPALVYQVMLFTGNGYYYILVGNASEEQEKNLELFKKMAGSFKRK